MGPLTEVATVLVAVMLVEGAMVMVLPQELVEVVDMLAVVVILLALPQVLVEVVMLSVLPPVLPPGMGTPCTFRAPGASCRCRGRGRRGGLPGTPAGRPARPRN